MRSAFGGLVLASILVCGSSPAWCAEPNATAAGADASNGAGAAPVVTWMTPTPASTTTPQAPSASPPPLAHAATSAIPSTGAPHGLAVLAIGDAGTIAWPLAQAVYGDPGLRPSFGEVRARILVGEEPEASAPGDLRDLAEMRAAIHGQDAPSRQLLSAIAASLGVSGVVIVERNGGAGPRARVFVPSSGSFDAAQYGPDPSPQPSQASSMTWTATVESLHRAFAAPLAPPVTSAALAPPPPPPPVPHTDEHTRPFYKSPWFWGALGAAAFGAAAVYFATRDNSPDTIHLQVQVPR
jgi:hypothetical protein